MLNDRLKIVASSLVGRQLKFCFPKDWFGRVYPWSIFTSLSCLWCGTGPSDPKCCNQNEASLEVMHSVHPKRLVIVRRVYATQFCIDSNKPVVTQTGQQMRWIFFLLFQPSLLQYIQGDMIIPAEIVGENSMREFFSSLLGMSVRSLNSGFSLPEKYKTTWQLTLAVNSVLNRKLCNW